MLQAEKPKRHSVSGETYTVLELIDRSFRIYRVHFVTFIGIAAATSIFPLLLSLIIAYNNPAFALLFDQSLFEQALNDPNFTTNNDLSSTGLSWFVNILSFILSTVIGGSMMTYVASEAHNGNTTTIVDAFSAVRSRLVTVGAAYIVFGIVFGIAAFVSGLALFICIGIVAIPVVTYAYICINYLISPVLVLEQVQPMAGLRRAYYLAKHTFWRLFWVTFALGLISFLIGFGIGGVLIFIAAFFLEAANYTAFFVALSAMQIVLGVFLAPLSWIVVTLYYYDARVRQEGLDMFLSLAESANARPINVASPEPIGPYFERKDYRNMALLFVGLVVPFALLIVAIIGPALAA